MLTPERDYSIIAGVVAAALLSVLVLRCRKSDRDAGRRLLILDILVAAHTVEWILIVLVQLFAQWANHGATGADPVTWSGVVATNAGRTWLLGMALISTYMMSFIVYFWFPPVFLFALGKDDWKKPVLWAGTAVFAFYYLVALECFARNLH